MAKKSDTYEGTREEWDQIMNHCHRVHQSLLNDFFDGEETLKSEAFYRVVTGQPQFTSEEIKARVNKWLEKEKEIWNSTQEEL